MIINQVPYFENILLNTKNIKKFTLFQKNDSDHNQSTLKHSEEAVDSEIYTICKNKSFIVLFHF